MFTLNRSPRSSFSLHAFLAVLFVCLGALLFPASADLVDVYESDGILRDLIALDGDIVDINTGSSPPEFYVDAAPIGYIYKGRVVDGAAVFDFDNVFMDSNIIVTVTGHRPLVISAKGDMSVASVFKVSAGVAGGGAGGLGGTAGPGGAGGKGGAGGGGGAGGKGGKGGDANPSSVAGEDSELGDRKSVV